MEVLFFILAAFMFLGNISSKNKTLREDAVRQEKMDAVLDGMYNEYRNN